MTALVAPDAGRWQSWSAMISDFDGPGEMHGSGEWNLSGPPVPGRDGCAAFVTMTERCSPADPAGTRVPSTYFWIAADDGATDDELVGFLHLRHELNDFLLAEGGHIGYAVRPSARRRGHATRALRLGLAEAAALGIAEVLVTCDDDNTASRRAIEKCGGVLEDVRDGKRRYWISTRA
ncbi:MAG: GNAT family N-acetyltransferase [Gordonia sp. (in: high G+C Gram-positive bacteria)]|uniref:GNAT family N-acetyltransferase n=1 Tax=Gordonia sp. (in: high G+C Gram-positive bacteria) TaxID=84139 RepID=UPI0039E360A4